MMTLDNNTLYFYGMPYTQGGKIMRIYKAHPDYFTSLKYMTNAMIYTLDTHAVLEHSLDSYIAGMK